MTPKRLLLVLLVVSLPACGGQAGSETGGIRDKDIQSAVNQVRSGMVNRLEILYMPKEIETFVAVHPGQLEGSAYYRIIIEQFQRSRLRDNLVSALEGSDIRKVSDDSDVRWGCIFYNGKHRVLTMHFDRFGKGYVGQGRVATNGRIVGFLSRQFSCVWEGDYSP